MIRGDAIEYDNMSVGKNTHSTKMENMSQSAGCSFLHTHSCVCPTSEITLSRAGVKIGTFVLWVVTVKWNFGTICVNHDKSKMLYPYSSGTPESDLFASARPLPEVQTPFTGVEERNTTCASPAKQVNQSDASIAYAKLSALSTYILSDWISIPVVNCYLLYLCTTKSSLMPPPLPLMCSSVHTWDVLSHCVIMVSCSIVIEWFYVIDGTCFMVCDRLLVGKLFKNNLIWLLPGAYVNQFQTLNFNMFCVTYPGSRN